MFQEFKANYTLDYPKQDTASYTFKVNAPISGLNEFFTEFSGCSFNKGLYRAHHADAVEEWTENVLVGYPAFSNRILCFGYDWLGRQFALDFERVEAGEPLVLMFEPGTGEALEIPANFVGFHDSLLITHPDACLAVNFHGEWLGAGNEPLPHDRCAGYKKLLFFGGSDTVDNLESSDMDVYWTVVGKVLEKIRENS